MGASEWRLNWSLLCSGGGGSTWGWLSTAVVKLLRFEYECERVMLAVEAAAVLVVILLDEADYMLCGIWC